MLGKQTTAVRLQWPRNSRRTGLVIVTIALIILRLREVCTGKIVRGTILSCEYQEEIQTCGHTSSTLNDEIFETKE